MLESTSFTKKTTILDYCKAGLKTYLDNAAHQKEGKTNLLKNLLLICIPRDTPYTRQIIQGYRH